MRQISDRTLPQREWLDLLLFALAILEALYLFGLARTSGVFPIMGADFRAFLAAVRIAQAEGFPRIYDLGAHEAVQPALCAMGGAQGPCEPAPMVFPAVFVLAGLPLARLDPRVAFAGWTLLNLVGTLGLLRRWIHPRQGPDGRRRLAMALLSFPVFTNLLWGQFNLWLLLCVSAFLANWHRGRPWRAGLWLSGLLLKPQTMVLVVPALALARQGRILGGWAIGTALGLGLSFLLAGPSGTAEWFRVLTGFAQPLPTIAPGVVGAETMMNWRSIGALLARWLPAPWAWALSGGGMLLTAIGALRLARTARLETEHGRECFLLGILAATLALTWHAHPHTAMILLPPLLHREAKGALPWPALVLWALAPAAVPFVDILLGALGLLPPIAGLDPLIAGKLLFGFHLYWLGFALRHGRAEDRIPAAPIGPEVP